MNKVIYFFNGWVSMKAMIFYLIYLLWVVLYVMQEFSKTYICAKCKGITLDRYFEPIFINQLTNVDIANVEDLWSSPYFIIYLIAIFKPWLTFSWPDVWLILKIHMIFIFPRNIFFYELEIRDSFSNLL